ncbi:uncharacterized protein LOC143854333 [Tasmannia lanceolata]|uniref:uncharacterized protein LOC143854333 n=1 Tax=Tasmannia lanceolata TaxID=3420 RepID=UPI0040643A04
MPAMENSLRYSRDSQLRSSFKQRRSGYEPSDTETDWQESPWHDLAKIAQDPVRNISPLSHNERYSSKLNHDPSESINASKTSPIPKRNIRSPYKPNVDDDNGNAPKSGYDPRRTRSPFAVSERRRHISPYKTSREEYDGDLKGSSHRQNQRQPHKFLNSEKNGAPFQVPVASRVGEKSNYGHRSVSAPKFRERQKEQQIRYGSSERIEYRSPPLLVRNPNQKLREICYSNPSGEINEMVANAKLSKGPVTDVLTMDSIETGDIFFSHECTALQKNITSNKNGFERSIAPKPKVVSERNTSQHQIRGVGTFDQNAQVSLSTVLSRSNTSSNSAVSRQSIGKTSTTSSKMSYTSGNTSESFRKFTANRQKNQTGTWLACVRAPCRTLKSPETNEIDEASFIEKAFVVENLRQFWADKHRSSSLNGFICNKQQAQNLKQLISHNNCPHILFKGPSGSGKKALSMALLREIYGAPAWNISHDLRSFHVQETSPMQVIIPLTSSPHHVELNVRTESKNVRFALMAIVKEIISSLASTPEVSTANFMPDYKVIILYEADKLAENAQHLIKWIMDCYTDKCKIILCCEDDTNLLESVKNRCELIMVDAPVIHGIMEVLIQIARKENFDLPMSFAARIATKSKQNLRKAIMALEACKAHNYPFVDEQPIPLGWEEVTVELAMDILADPSHRRLNVTRGKLQKLLVEFVHPKLILQKLVEQFLKGIEASLKRELYYWHAYYDKRLPVGTGASLKLEEFVAKFMGIYRKSFGGRQY